MPEVTGVSPCEGYPNTKIKIWGENLGTSAADVISVKICGQECVDSVEWVSERKIICNSGNGYGRGRVIVETITGGKGSCAVYFTGLENSAPQSPSTHIYMYMYIHARSMTTPLNKRMTFICTLIYKCICIGFGFFIL